MLSLISLAISASIVLIFRFINNKYKPPILGIYQQRNKTYWIKFLYMYTFLYVRKLWAHIRTLLDFELDNTDEVTYIQQYNAHLENKYNLGDYANSVDGVYFNGVSENDEAIICGLVRRPNRICDSFLYLKLKGEDLLLSPTLPDTYIEKHEKSGDDYSVGGVSIKKIIPMRAWRLKYTGEMKSRRDPTRIVKVTANLTWSAQWPHFEYDKQMSPLSVADDMAREPWSRDYFTLVKKLHKTNYEQIGYISGRVTVDDAFRDIHMPCVRNRSYGTIREWRNFHRYVYHFIFLKNGDCMAVGSVSLPAVMSHFTTGYLCRHGHWSAETVDSSDFQLYQHGENEILPKNYAFSFKAGGKSYLVRVQVIEDDFFYVGKDREAKFYERWSDVEVNGVKGKACVEWHFNNTGK